MRSLKSYAKQNNVPLKLAIFWSSWGKWTLIDTEKLDCSQKKLRFGLGDAYAQNEMLLLGDHWVGLTPPLSVRLFADMSKSTKIDDDGMAKVFFKRLCLCANGVEITNPIEKAIAWFLIQNGNWSRVENSAKVTNNSLDYTATQFFTEESNGELPFNIVGMMSDMLSLQCRRLVTKDGEIRNLIPQPNSERMAPLIPDGYSGDVLKLEKISIQPNSNLLKKISDRPGRNFIG